VPVSEDRGRPRESATRRGGEARWEGPLDLREQPHSTANDAITTMRTDGQVGIPHLHLTRQHIGQSWGFRTCGSHRAAGDGSGHARFARVSAPPRRADARATDDGHAAIDEAGRSPDVVLHDLGQLGERHSNGVSVSNDRTAHVNGAGHRIRGGAILSAFGTRENECRGTS
jgi:hypothetical protein